MLDFVADKRIHDKDLAEEGDEEFDSIAELKVNSTLFVEIPGTDIL